MPPLSLFNRKSGDGEKQMAKTKEERTYEDRQPILTRKISLSKDKKWLIMRTIRTDIVHVNYMDKVLSGGVNNG